MGLATIDPHSLTKKCMASGRRVGQRPDCHTFSLKFWHFQMAVHVSQWRLAWLTPNLGILWISVCSFWLCESIVANPIIYRLVPRLSRFETRQYGSVCLPFRIVTVEWSGTRSLLFWWRHRFSDSIVFFVHTRKQRFQKASFSNRSTLESVFQWLRFRWSFSAL